MKILKHIAISGLALSVLLNPTQTKATSLLSSLTEGLLTKGLRRTTSILKGPGPLFYQDKSFYSTKTTSDLTSRQVSTSGQVYGFGTYDALFKYVLSNEEIAPPFLRAFLPGMNIVSAKRLDDHMNPLQELQNLREFVNKTETNQTALDLVRASNVHVVFQGNETEKARKHDRGTLFLHKVLDHFGDIKNAFPLPRYKGTMDFVCESDKREFAIVEMQVVPQDYWDYRGLAYAAYVFGNQLKKGDHWRDLKKVVAINILGNKDGNKPHWKTPEFVRHYKFQDQTRASRFIDGIELIQYSLANAPQSIEDQAQKDWITYFKRGHVMTKEEVQATIKTPEVLKAFELSELNKLPWRIRAEYDEEDREYDRYSLHTKELVQDGKKEQKEEIALGMLKKDMDVTMISELTGLTEEEIKSLESEKKN